MSNRIRFSATTGLALALALALPTLGGGARADEPHVIKLATLAPEGSAWMGLFHGWAREVEAHTGGQVRLKFYAGGVSGDERDFVRKMRLGQLGGAAVTSIGLGLVQPEVRVLEVPMLIASWEELDFVRHELDAELRAKLADKGYVLLGWGDVGPIHLFSNIPVRARADLAKTRMWEWSDDPLSRALFKRLGTTSVPLGAPDVLPALSTGMVDAAFGTPLAVLALQWHTKVRYMTSLQLGFAIGAIVITRRELDRLTPAQQQILIADSRELERKLLAQVRGDNERARATLEKAGLRVIDSPPALKSELAALAQPLRADLDGTVYSRAFRERVEAMVARFRARSAHR